MDQITTGEVVVPATNENLGDLVLVARDFQGIDQARRVEVPDGMARTSSGRFHQNCSISWPIPRANG